MAKMVVKRVGVFSYAKIMAITMAAMGLFIGVIYGLIFMIFGAAMMSGGRETAGAGVGGVVVGLLMMVGFPIFYGFIGFVFGALGALIYNVSAGFVGGIELELESADAGYAAPPPPQQQQWGAGQQQQPGQPHYPY